MPCHIQQLAAGTTIAKQSPKRFPVVKWHNTTGWAPLGGSSVSYLAAHAVGWELVEGGHGGYQDQFNLQTCRSFLTGLIPFLTENNVFFFVNL